MLPAAAVILLYTNRQNLKRGNLHKRLPPVLYVVAHFLFKLLHDLFFQAGYV